MLRGPGGPPRIPLAQEHEYPLVKRWRLMAGMEEAKLVWPFFTTYMKDGGEKKQKRKEDRETWDRIIWSPNLQHSSLNLFTAQIKTAGLT